MHNSRLPGQMGAFVKGITTSRTGFNAIEASTLTSGHLDHGAHSGANLLGVTPILLSWCWPLAAAVPNRGLYFRGPLSRTEASPLGSTRRRTHQMVSLGTRTGHMAVRRYI